MWPCMSHSGSGCLVNNILFILLFPQPTASNSLSFFQIMDYVKILAHEELVSLFVPLPDFSSHSNFQMHLSGLRWIILQLILASCLSYKLIYVCLYIYVVTDLTLFNHMCIFLKHRKSHHISLIWRLIHLFHLRSMQLENYLQFRHLQMYLTLLYGLFFWNVAIK